MPFAGTEMVDGRAGGKEPLEFQEVVRRRHMCRSFDGEPLPPGVVEVILSNALRAPSAGFTQGTEFLVLEAPGGTARFWDVCLPSARRSRFPWPGLFRAPLLIIPFANKDAYLDRYAEADKGWTDRDDARWQVPYWFVDSAFAAMLVLLTAVDSGLGALFFRVADPSGVREEFAVPSNFDPVGAIALGYPAADDRPSSSTSRPRRPAGAVVHRGRWSG